MKSAHKFVVPMIWALGCIIFILAIVGVVSIPECMQKAEPEVSSTEGTDDNDAETAEKSGAGGTQLIFDIFVAILVLSLLMAVLAAVHVWMKKQTGSKNYDIEQQPSKAGAENKAFEGGAEGEGAKQSGPAGKWTKNYVPFKGFPKGSSGQSQDSENRVEVVNEVSDGKSIEKKDSEKGSSSDEKWKKNYVPYQEPTGEEDSNKQ